MNFKPLNRHLWVEPANQDTEEEGPPPILLPDGYRPERSGYEAVKVLAIAPDCKLTIETSDIIIVQSAMIEKVEYGNCTYQVILENHVLGTIN